MRFGLASGPNGVLAGCSGSVGNDLRGGAAGHGRGLVESFSFVGFGLASHRGPCDLSQITDIDRAGREMRPEMFSAVL